MGSIPWPRSGVAQSPCVPHTEPSGVLTTSLFYPMSGNRVSIQEAIQDPLGWREICVTKHAAKYKIYGIRELQGMKASIHKRKFPLMSQFGCLSSVSLFVWFWVCFFLNLKICWSPWDIGTCKGACQLLQVWGLGWSLFPRNSGLCGRKAVVPNNSKWHILYPLRWAC